MEVTDLNDFMSVRSIKMETENNFVDGENVDDDDALSIIPQYVTESDLGTYCLYALQELEIWVDT